MTAEIEKWLEENNAKYYALTFYHVQTPRYLEKAEVEKMTLFESRAKAVNNYLDSRVKLLTDSVLSKEPFSLATVAVVPVTNIQECINGKDIIAAVNANIYKAHGINGQVLDSDVDETAYDFIDANAKDIVKRLIRDLSVKTKAFMQCHFLQHSMGIPEIQDFMLLKSREGETK